MDDIGATMRVLCSQTHTVMAMESQCLGSKPVDVETGPVSLQLCVVLGAKVRGGVACKFVVLHGAQCIRSGLVDSDGCLRTMDALVADGIVAEMPSPSASFVDLCCGRGTLGQYAKAEGVPLGTNGGMLRFCHADVPPPLEDYAVLEVRLLRRDTVRVSEFRFRYPTFENVCGSTEIGKQFSLIRVLEEAEAGGAERRMGFVRSSSSSASGGHGGGGTKRDMFPGESWKCWTLFGNVTLYANRNGNETLEFKGCKDTPMLQDTIRELLGESVYEGVHRNCVLEGRGPGDPWFRAHMAVVTFSVGQRFSIHEGCLLESQLCKYLGVSVVSFPMRMENEENCVKMQIHMWKPVYEFLKTTLSVCVARRRDMMGAEPSQRNWYRERPAEVLALVQRYAGTSGGQQPQQQGVTLTVSARGHMIARLSWENERNTLWSDERAICVLHHCVMIGALMCLCG